MQFFSDKSFTLKIMALGLSQIINWGVLYYSLSLIGPQIISDMHWSEVFVYSGFSLATIIAGLLAPLSGSAIDRIGGRQIMSVGSLIGASGVSYLATISSIYEYIFAWVIIGISMSMCLYDSAFASIAKISGNEMRRAISSITLIAGFSSTLTWPATAFLLSSYNWRSIIFFYALLMAFVSVPILFFSLKDQSDRSIVSIQKTKTEINQKLNINDKAFPPNLKAKVMLLLGLIMASQGFIANAISIHVISLFESIGLGTYGAILAGALIGSSQVGARFIELVFGKHINPMSLGLITIALLPISLFVPLAMPEFIITGIIFGITFGISNGLFTIVRGTLPHILFGPLGYGQRLGNLSAPTLIFKAIAPAVFGYLLSVNGPNIALLTLFSVSIIACLAMLKLSNLVK